MLPLRFSFNTTHDGQSRWRVLSSRRATLVGIVAAVTLCFTLLYLRLPRNAGVSQGPIPQIVQNFQDLASAKSGNGRLHFLVPATSSNPDLCKLMLSAQVLGYPTPILINYGDKEAQDAYVQHLAKVEGILHYLEQLEASDEYAEELVLIVDGFDVVMQLRPDVLIKRYYQVNAAADERAIETYGEDLVKQHDIRQTIVFGSDKLCWPVDFSRSACWAVPESPLPNTTFGTPVGHMDRDKNPAKWLNSGTILGPAQDLKEVFAATLEAIHTNYTTDSDQFYFANIFGDQEYARLALKPELLEQAKQKPYYDDEDAMNGTMQRWEPDLRGTKTEYHIGIDYTSTMFQALAFWKQHLVWTRAIHSWTGATASVYPDNPRQMVIPQDVLKSQSPFEPYKYGMNGGSQPSWSEVELAYNVLTKEIPVMLHITGNPEEKRYRAWYWQNLWFQSEGEKIRQANLKLDQRVISSEPIAGLEWFNADAGDAEEIERGGKGGAWSDRRGWLSWKKLCKAAEEDIYHVGQDFWHPDPLPLEEGVEG